jgi:hypothetical protein
LTPACAFAKTNTQQHNTKGKTMTKNANTLTAEQQAKADAWRAAEDQRYQKEHGMTLAEAEAMARFFND